MRAAVLFAIAVSGLAGPALAGTLAVPLNHSVRLALSGSAASVVVGNPQIADVTVVDSRTLFVSGKGMGSTDVTVVDGLGRTIYNADVLVSSARRGHVAIYRGGDKGTERADLACSPRCEDAVKSSIESATAGAPAPVAAAAPASAPMPAAAVPAAAPSFN